MLTGEQSGAVPNGDTDLERVFEIKVCPHKKQVTITEPEETEFFEWMMACEFLMHVTAQKSMAGYEKALDLLREGAMTYRVLQKENEDV